MAKRSQTTAKEPVPRKPTARIRIYVRSGLATIEPVDPSLLTVVDRSERRHVAGGPFGYQEVTEVIRAARLDEDGRLVVSRGLVSRIRKVLRQNGYEVTVERIGTIRRKGDELDVEFFERAQGKARDVLLSVQRKTQGLIQVSNFDETLSHVANLCRLFPRARIVIPAASKRKVAKVWRVLKQKLEERVGVATGGYWRSDHRILVCEFGSVASCNNPHMWNVVLVPFAQDVVGERAGEAMAVLTKQRVYGFSVLRKPSGPKTQLRLEMIFGTVIHRRSPPRARVRVLWRITPSCPPVNLPRGLEFKRQAYWKNHRRNDAIAAVARAFAARDIKGLRQRGLGLAADHPLLSTRAKLRIAVLVESTEHGRELLRRLQGWKFLNAIPMRVELSEDGYPHDGFRISTSRLQIVTEARAAQSGLAVDVLIRATGGDSPFRSTGFPPRLDDLDSEEALLVDFRDGFNPLTARLTRHREQDYERHGWDVESSSQGWGNADSD